MNTHSRRMLAVVMMTTLALSPLAEAKRVGGGKSYGMSRSNSSYGSASNRSDTYRPAPVRIAPAPQRSANRGIGMGTVAGAAVAAGAAGYMLGHANNAQAAPNATSENPINNQVNAPAAPNNSGFSWLWLIALAGLAYWVYRRFAAKKSHVQPAPFAQSTPNAFGLSGSPATGFGGPAPFQGTNTLPDGMTHAAFLRMARANFLHLQTMNNSAHVEELRRYFTPDMYQQIRAEVVANQDTAEFPQLNAHVIDSSSDGAQHIASVRFHGTVSESLDAPAVPFSETWHFVKPINGSSDWLVAGIQQN